MGYTRLYHCIYAYTGLTKMSITFNQIILPSKDSIACNTIIFAIINHIYYFLIKLNFFNINLM